MIWSAVFLLCLQGDCFVAGSPLFSSKPLCELEVSAQGLSIIKTRFPDHTLIDWKCISFGVAGIKNT